MTLKNYFTIFRSVINYSAYIFMDTKIELKVLYSDISKMFDRLIKIDILNLYEEKTLQRLYVDIDFLPIKLNRSFIDKRDGYDRFNNTETETRSRNIRKVWTIIEFKLNDIKMEKEKIPTNCC